MPTVACPNCGHRIVQPADAAPGSFVRCPRCTSTFDPDDADQPRRARRPARRKGGLPVWVWLLIAVPFLMCFCVGGVVFIGYTVERRKAADSAPNVDLGPVTTPDAAWARARGSWRGQGPMPGDYELELTDDRNQRHARSIVRRPGFRESRGFTVVAIELLGDGKFVLKAPATKDAQVNANNDLGFFWFDGVQLVRQPAGSTSLIRYNRVP